MHRHKFLTHTRKLLRTLTTKNRGNIKRHPLNLHLLNNNSDQRQRMIFYSKSAKYTLNQSKNNMTKLNINRLSIFQMYALYYYN